MHVPRGLGDRKGRICLSVNASVRRTSKGNRQGYKERKMTNKKKNKNDRTTDKQTRTNGEPVNHRARKVANGFLINDPRCLGNGDK